MGLVARACSLSQKRSVFPVGWLGKPQRLSTSLGSDPENQALNAAGQEGGVPLSFEQIIKKIKEGMQGVEGGKALLLAEAK